MKRLTLTTLCLLALLLVAPQARAKDSALMKRMRRASVGAVYVSEITAPFTAVRRDAAFLRRLRSESAKQMTFEQFISGQGAADADNYARLRAMGRVGRRNLRGLRVYFSGRGPEYSVYVLGTTKRGGVLGWRTEAVETPTGRSLMNSPTISRDQFKRVAAKVAADAPAILRKREKGVDRKSALLMALNDRLREKLGLPPEKLTTRGFNDYQFSSFAAVYTLASERATKPFDYEKAVDDFLKRALR
jgi:hypothetical protein